MYPSPSNEIHADLVVMCLDDEILSILHCNPHWPSGWSQDYVPQGYRFNSQLLIQCGVVGIS
jgi:hypothetical protein